MESENDEEDASIYRQAAVENYSNISHSEYQFSPIQYKKWITRTVFVLLIVCGISWLFFGTIPLEIQGVAIAANEEGFANIETMFNGIVREIKFKTGGHVQQGDLLAFINNPEVQMHLQVINQTIESLQKRIDHLDAEIEKERLAEEKGFIEAIEAAQYKISILTDEIEILKEDVLNKEDLAQRGLLDSQSLQEGKELLWTKQIDLESARTTLSHFNFLLKKEYRQKEIQALSQELLSLKQEKSLAEVHLKHQNIYSPFTGILIEWFIQPNKVVAEGDLIARLELQQGEKGDKIFFGYLPVEEGKKVKLNAEVTLELTAVKFGDYGAIVGNIVGISPYAVTPENLASRFHNPQLIRYFFHNHEALLEVLIKPQQDPKTISGYRWTSADGAPIQLSSGTLCTFKTTAGKMHPYLSVVPAWWIKKKLHDLFGKGEDLREIDQ